MAPGREWAPVRRGAGNWRVELPCGGIGEYAAMLAERGKFTVLNTNGLLLRPIR